MIAFKKDGGIVNTFFQICLRKYAQYILENEQQKTPLAFAYGV
ncbi:hypothetical protein HMPREF1050_0581 [Haemophilus parahaemolyticus HK385]|uniref:Uncharacterized protein n=1 Tax=Haemophilus parahaemolyticus HK385 TaxID=1095744 RepID=A0ABP2P2W9_HAEPH|nr:hypothetical protein HMPREF1050_0581 [Haemophilus parahaemolyticus HK385]